MCFSQPKMPAMPEIPPPPPPPAPPPPPLEMAKKAPTKRATQAPKRRRGTQQVTAVRRSTLNMGNAARSGVGVQLSQ
jgi:hypothetical protein